MALKLKFNSSEPGLWVSGTTHVVLLVAALAGLSIASEFPEAQEGIPVEVITDNQFSQITKGEKTAKTVLPDPKPRAERVADKAELRDPGEDKRDAPAPPKRPEEMKVADKEEPVAAQPPPPPPPSKPTQAEAEAKATQMVSQAIAAGDVQAINYFVANNYIKALEGIATSPNQKVLMLPVEAASVIGAVGGIAEIARETFGQERPAPVRANRPPNAG